MMFDTHMLTESKEKKQDEFQRISTEARARVLWGDPKDKVRQFMLEEGADRARTEQFLIKAMLERREAVRQKGSRDVVIGSLMVIGFVVGYLLMGSASEDGMLTRSAGKAMGAMLVAFIAGVIFVARGIERLVKGENIRGAISDLTEE